MVECSGMVVVAIMSRVDDGDGLRWNPLCVTVGKLFRCVDDRVSDFSEFHHSQQHTRHHSDDIGTRQELEKGTGGYREMRETT